MKRTTVLLLALVASVAVTTSVIADSVQGNTDGGAAPAIDATRLVKFEDRVFSVRHEDWVATEPLSTTVVKKIEGGRVSHVNIVTTATGTYSTDAMFSDHVQYPGIEVNEISMPMAAFFFWQAGHWLHLPVSNGNSFLYLDNGKTQVFRSGSTTCVGGVTYTVC